MITFGDENGKIINHKEVEAFIIKIEEIVIELDYIEKNFLYDILIGRNQERVNQAKMNDAIGNADIGKNLINKITSKLGGVDELDI